MLRFLIVRLAQGLVVVLAVQLISFALLKLKPGGPFDRERNVPEHVRKQQDAAYGYDKPVYVQFWRHVHGLFTLDLPPSPKNPGRPVGDVIRQGFPISARIGITALGIALFLGIPMGAYSALRPNTLGDRGTMLLATLGICAPSLVLGPVLALVFGLGLGWFNVSGWYDPSDLVLPSLTLGIIYSAYIARLTRGSLVETLANDFVRTARAKGVEEREIVFKHAAKLACLPLLNYLGPVAAGLLTGSFVIERVFQIPGLGQHFVDAAVNTNFELALPIAALYAALIVGFNLVVDILQAALNPRIGLKS